MDYQSFFTGHLDRLRTEGRYRVFAELERIVGAFPRARFHQDGTVRDVTLFIPAQYDGKRPACVYVKTDGFNPREKQFMEEAIAAKE